MARIIEGVSGRDCESLGECGCDCEDCPYASIVKGVEHIVIATLDLGKIREEKPVDIHPMVQ